MQALRRPGHDALHAGVSDDLELAHLWVVYPGDEAYPLDDRISVLPIAGVPELARSLGVGKERDASARPGRRSILP